jgi:hypothetical protein
MATSAIEGVLWPGCRALAPKVSALGGITAFKTGYHGPRNWMKANHPNDYSIQLAIDKLGPGDEGSALDWTFTDAQKSDFSTIAKFSRRLFKAGQEKDPRAYPLREFYGNTDSDREVEGWSYYRNRAGSSDSTHLWHIHMSIYRKYINDAAAMRSILSILSGEEDDVALSDEDIQKIAKAVWALKIIDPPEGFGEPGQKWSTGGTLEFNTDKLVAIEKKLPEPTA